MDVIRDAGARDPTEVPAEVEASRAVQALERGYGRDDETVDLECLVCGQLAEHTDVPARGDHEVPRRVRELVQDRDRVAPSMDEERRVLSEAAGGLLAEHAAHLLVRLRDVLEPPRSPEPVGHVPFLSALGGCPTTQSLVDCSSMMRYGVKLAAAAIAFLLGAVLIVLIFDRIWFQVGLGAALLILCGGFVFLAWIVDRREKEKRAGLDDLPPV